MSDTQHTKGPWTLSEETHRDGLRSKLLHGMPEGMLAIIRVEHQGRYYGDANARLIAAAPELLEALTALVDINENGGPFGGELYRDRVERAFDAARTAIAKATA
ncbi:hypothetical protein [Rhizobium leguminosarum]|uniref:hypothetical protein n=1 Tax=Rhizobium leguminosarum TaxID=384 RepID=UPI001C96D131|nr:hypothetical protein [Rhizobium leguminosarum]MBY5821451.1 hypothetical protein [Rhizobium leguminosarum]